MIVCVRVQASLGLLALTRMSPGCPLTGTGDPPHTTPSATLLANTLIIIITSYGPHILAIVEDPEQYNVCQTVKEHSENMRRPVIWHVPGGAYSKNEAVSWLVCKARAVCTCVYRHL